MILSHELELGGLAALGAIGSVCAVLLKSTHQNLKTLDTMRQEATAATDKLREELQDHDNTIFKLQELCADYRLAIAKLEAERNAYKQALQELQHSLTAEHQKFKTRPEDIL